MTSATTKLAVLGSPIAHSKSPTLHGAAYRMLGLEWDYARHDVDEARLASFLERRGAGWRGLSLTMPLKSAIIEHCRTVSPIALRAGAVNTVVFATSEPDSPFDGYNTDVEGVIAALDEADAAAGPVELLGAGNTASSVILACFERGARDLTIRARSPERARGAAELARSLGMRIRVHSLADAIEPRHDGVDVAVVANTIPGGTELRVAYPAEIRRTATLFDAIYDRWPTALAAHWAEAGGAVVSGLEMLLHQAVAQVRLFVRPGDGAAEVSDAELVAGMRAALA